ncbi:MAG: PepSY-associated TM helix domain-containing protein [Pseudomonadota bacterium]
MNGTFRQSMTWLHTWTGLILCWLLYFVFVTGTLGYFDTEIDLWMSPETPVQKASDPVANIRLGQARLAEVAPDSERWFIYPNQSRNRPHMGVGWLEKDPETGNNVFHGENLDSQSGQPLPDARDTGGGQLLYRMHYLLHYFPNRIGYWLVAFATMLMFVGMITGIIAHKKIFKDFFTFRWAKGSRSWLDAHNLLSVSTLPFQLMITYSGLLYTLGLFWMPLVVLGGYGFDMDKVRGLQDILGVEQVEKANEAAPLVAIEGLVTDAADSPQGDQINLVIIDFPGDANSEVSFVMDGIGRTGGENFAYNGASGERLDKPGLELPNASAKFALSMIDLHEGTFAGPFLRWLYFLAGLMGTAMIATGAIYYVQSRKRKTEASHPGFGFRLVECMNAATIAGLLTAIGVFYLSNRLLPLGMENRAEWEVHCMFLAWAACFVHAAVRQREFVWSEQLYALAAVYLILPVINAMTTQAHLGNSLPAGDWILAGFDLMALATGLIALALGLKLRPRREQEAQVVSADVAVQ